MRSNLSLARAIGVLLVTGVASAGGYGHELPVHLPSPFGALAWAALGLGGAALLARGRDPEADAG